MNQVIVVATIVLYRIYIFVSVLVFNVNVHSLSSSRVQNRIKKTLCTLGIMLAFDVYCEPLQGGVT